MHRMTNAVIALVHASSVLFVLVGFFLSFLLSITT